MAAPNSAYRTSVVDIYDALLIQVSHKCAIPAVDKATFLSRFKLDDIFAVDLPDGTGWIGMVNVTGQNYNYHAPARVGALTESRPEGMYVFLNDGGLNTSGFTSITSVDNAGNYGTLTFWATFVSAFYHVSNQYGFRMYIFDGVSYNFYDELIKYNIPANESEVGVLGFFNLPESNSGQARIMSFITNSEKTYLSTNRYIQVNWMSFEISGGWDRTTGNATANLSAAPMKAFSYVATIFWGDLTGGGGNFNVTFNFGIGVTQDSVNTDSYFDKNEADEVFVEANDTIFQSNMQLVF